MKTKQKHSLCLFLAVLSLAIPAVAGDKQKEKEKGTAKNPLTLAELAEGIQESQMKRVVVSGTIVGACRSGCKMWIADGAYQEGDLFALVRAKDDAFKFDSAAIGKTVKLHGFAVAELLDYCAEKGEKKADGNGGKNACASPGGANRAITFFATKVNYGG